MNFLRAVYDGLERAMFNTLNRKILGNLLPLTLFTLLPVLAWWILRGRIEETLTRGGSSAELASAIRPLLDTGNTWFWLLAGGGLAIFVIDYLFLRYLMINPVKRMITFFNARDSKEVDLSDPLPVTTVDEYQDLAESYNRFLENLREMIATVRQMGVNIAVNSCRAAKSIGETTANAQIQESMAGDIFNSSEQSTQAIEQVAQNSQEVSATTSNNVEMARSSMGELHEATQKIDQSLAQLKDFEGTVTTLNVNSEKISKIVNLIQNIAFQTNLLALNAAVEAARAGQHGKGFAVVAEEVRTLATRVNQATHDVSESISAMTGLVGKTASQAGTIMENIGETKTVIDSAHQHFTRIVDDLDNNSGQLMRIASATEQLSASNVEIHSKVSEVRNTSLAVSEQMSKADQATSELGGITEQMQETVSRFIIGRGNFERILATARSYRDEGQRLIEEMARRGINVMDRNHVPIPGTNPQKYQTAYDKEFESAFQSMVDSHRSKLEGAIYTLLMDSGGYIATHHSNVSQPLTGNYEQDLVNSRHKRIYMANKTEQRRAQNTQPFLLQTYSRDTGEILNDLSLPIYINGQHWGAYIIGFDPQLLLQE